MLQKPDVRQSLELVAAQVQVGEGHKPENVAGQKLDGIIIEDEDLEADQFVEGPRLNDPNEICVCLEKLQIHQALKSVLFQSDEEIAIYVEFFQRTQSAKHPWFQLLYAITPDVQWKGTLKPFHFLGAELNQVIFVKVQVEGHTWRDFDLGDFADVSLLAVKMKDAIFSLAGAQGVTRLTNRGWCLWGTDILGSGRSEKQADENDTGQHFGLRYLWRKDRSMGRGGGEGGKKEH